MDRGIWFAVETLANSYEANAVKILIEDSNFSREKCLILQKETGLPFNGKTMEIVDFEMGWKKYSSSKGGIQK